MYGQNRKSVMYIIVFILCAISFIPELFNEKK